MKKKLNEIFDEAKPKELDQFSDELNAPELPDEVLASVKVKVYAKTKVKSKRKNNSGIWMRFGAIAACFLLIVSVIIAVPMLREDDPGVIPGPGTDIGSGSAGVEDEPDIPIITPPNNNSSDISLNDNSYVIESWMEYLNFEDACELASDVVVATFTGSRPYGASFTEYSFTVKNRLLGNAPEQINVYAMDAEIVVENESVAPYNAQELFLEHNTDYLLLLDHRVSVYNETDIYQFVCNIYIDFSDINKSMMYNQPIASHSSTFDFANTDTDSVLAYVKELVKNNTPSPQPVKNPELKDIITASTDIVVITVNRCEKKVINDFRNTGFFACTIEETLKGTLSVGESVQILFKLDDVEEGDKIIVALNNYDKATYYRITSLNSIFSIDNKGEFLSILETK